MSAKAGVTPNGHGRFTVRLHPELTWAELVRFVAAVEVVPDAAVVCRPVEFFLDVRCTSCQDPTLPAHLHCTRGPCACWCNPAGRTRQ